MFQQTGSAETLSPLADRANAWRRFPRPGRISSPMTTALLLLVLFLTSACQSSEPAGVAEPTTVSAETIEAATIAAAGSPAGKTTRAPFDLATHLRFESLSVAEGLSQGTVNCIFQDSYGFMWLGTDDGLNKYDGYSFTTYKHDPEDPHSLSHNRVWTIFEDQSGVLWIGTYGGGLNKFDRDTEQFTHYDAEDFQNVTDEPEEFRNVVWAIDEGPVGVLWIATYGGGLVKFELATGAFTSYAPDPDDARFWGHEWLTALLVDSSGILWLGTHSEGLDRFDPRTGQITSYKHHPDNPTSLGHDWITSIIEDESGRLWIGTFGRGLDRFDPETETFTHYRHDPANPHSLGDNAVWRILEDASGVLWIGTYDGGLDAFDQERTRFFHFSHRPDLPHSLSSNRIRSIFEDRSGVLWVGTRGGGVNKSDSASGQFAHYQGYPQGASDYFVNAIYEDAEGLLWIGTANRGLNVLDRSTGEWRLYQHDPENPHSLGNDAVSSILEDASGVFWIGTGDGLYQFDRETEQFVRSPHHPPDTWDVKIETIYAICEDSEGTLWFGTHGRGLSEWDPATGRFIYHQPNGAGSMSNNFVLDVHEDRSGILWAGTEEGLNYLDRETGRWHSYQHDPDDPTSLSHNWVWSIHEDRTGTLWIGTLGGGLNRFDREGQAFDHYGEPDGLASDLILDIVDDDRGRLWLGTANGLSLFDPQRETFTNYGAHSGLPIFDFNTAFQSPRGELFFGGVNGFISFFPDQIAKNSHLPPIALTSLQQHGRELDTGAAPEATSAITLRWPDNNFEFEFAALTFSQPERNQHAYMLEGFDQEWLDGRHGRYTNLPGGTYTLRLKGSNNDAVWNDTGTTITVTVVPPFWETWWFQGVAVLVLLAAVAGGFRWRVQRVEARSRELAQQVGERTMELAEANIRLYQEIEERQRAEEELAQQRAEAAVAEERNRLARDLHDSVTQSIYSLTLLSEAGRRMADAEDLAQLATNQSRIGDISQQALQEMRLLVYELRPPALEAEGLAGALEHRLEVVERRAGVDARLTVAGALDLPAALEEELYHIAQEALNNALKHARATAVAVTIGVDADVVTLEVRDDGRGFESASARGAGGLGLVSMRERTERIGGELAVHSAPGAGTTVRVTIPRHAESYSEVHS